jgi:hypothetical protein
LEAALDGEVFLANLDASDPPLLVFWSAEPHLVFAFHGHSGTVCAAELGVDDPQVLWGFDDDPEPTRGEVHPPISFSRWVFSVVDAHERVLDYWQTTYEKCQGDPIEARRLGNLDWIRRLPGMVERLERRTNRSR